MTEDNTYEESLDDAGGFSAEAPSGDEAASQVSEAITLPEIEQTLGKKFPDKATALKAFKDTFSYVGSLGQKVKTLESQAGQAPQELVQTVETLKKQVQDATFYSEHPELKGYEDLVEAFGGPEKALDNEKFKSRFEAVKAHDEAQKSKSVLMTNPRIGQVTDKMSQAREAVKAGNHSAAEAAAVAAVIDSFGLGK